MFDFSMSGLMLTFQANPMHLKEALGETTQKTTQEMPEKTSEKILGLIGENTHITIAELASAIGVTGRSIERNIQKLQQHGKLKRVGPAKGGYWEVLK
ncbi:DUF977 family protein [Mariprofundus ferrooxydans]|nr:DUF977 family protein [Mariprofundus ferrooxydans]